MIIKSEKFKKEKDINFQYICCSMKVGVVQKTKKSSSKVSYVTQLSFGTYQKTSYNIKDQFFDNCIQVVF